MRGDIRLAIVSMWRELTVRWRAWALVGAGVANLGAVIYVINLVAEARWQLPAAQIDTLKLLGIILALTNAVVVIAIAGVGVQAKGPAGFSFDVDSEGKDDRPQARVEAKVSAEVTQQ